MKLRKEFGQHFLKDESICIQIIETLKQNADTNIPLLEIGPGGGAITKYLLPENFSDYKMVEIDPEKVAFLINELKVSPTQIISQDFLQIDAPFQSSFNVIGNFPYNISSQIMFRILDWKEQIENVVGMFQKEVAVRIASKEGNKDYGILSVILQAFFDIKYAFDVPPAAFNPPPKVMSGVITLQNNHNKYTISNPVKFAKFIKVAFAMRRKTLRNNYKGILDSMELESEFYNLRAEQVSVVDFVNLYKRIYES